MSADAAITQFASEATRLVLLAKATEAVLNNIPGENPDREGLAETPMRAAKAWVELTSGYSTDIEQLFKTFESPSQRQGMVIVRGIRFTSLCEHHLLPFYGKVDIGYIPDQRILGLSKFARVTDAYARRLQVQEKMCDQIADAIMGGLSPSGVMVVARAVHLCMEARGISAQGAETVTSSIRGVFEKAEVRQEFLSLRGDR